MADISVLRRVVRYDSDTGDLFWLERDADLFEPGPVQTSAQKARAWNARWANTIALAAVNSSGYPHGTIFGKGIIKLAPET